MASEKARIAKDKGNSAFKAADYPTAIGHYTEAILADSNDHTFYLNRAAAYLKLGKSEDAERDCTKVLALNPNNVKAFFRRGQARRALENLDEAWADLNRALALEPTNESVKKEIHELEEISQLQKLKQRSEPIAVGIPKITTPKRRRVPIEIIEAGARPSQETWSVTSQGSRDTQLLQAVSSRPLKQESEPTTIQPPPLKPQTFVEAKQAREEAKQVRVSGGIIRHTGNHTIVTRTSYMSAPSAQKESTLHAVASTPLSHRPPTTLFQFTKSWESLQTATERWNLILTIPQSSIPTLFQVSLDPDLLRSILHTFRAVLEQDSAPETRNSIRDYLLAFTKVQRFGTVILFMDKEERKLLELLHEKVNSTHS